MMLPTRRLHVPYLPVAAREQQMSALARAVVGEGDLPGVILGTFDSRFSGDTWTVRAAVSVWKLIHRQWCVEERLRPGSQSKARTECGHMHPRRQSPAVAAE
jgi:hypothetical protein